MFATIGRALAAQRAFIGPEVGSALHENVLTYC